MDNLLTVKEVMAALKLSRATIYRLIGQGKLVPVKVGGSVRFKEIDVERFVNGGSPTAEASAGHGAGLASSVQPAKAAATEPAKKGSGRAGK